MTPDKSIRRGSTGLHPVEVLQHLDLFVESIRNDVGTCVLGYL